jgi:hypothetical protein
MDDRCHEAWPENGRFLDLGADGPKDKWAEKGSESAQVAFGFVGPSSVTLILPVPAHLFIRSQDSNSVTRSGRETAAIMYDFYKAVALCGLE